MDRADDKQIGQTHDGAGAAPAQTVTLAKGRHRWVFSYRAGEEAGVLSAASDLAARDGAGAGGGGGFNWFDAALVSHQLARRLRAGIERKDKDESGT